MAPIPEQKSVWILEACYEDRDRFLRPGFKTGIQRLHIVGLEIGSGLGHQSLNGPPPPPISLHHPSIICHKVVIM